MLRLSALAIGGILGLAVSAATANAAPTIPATGSPHASNIVQVAGRCGWAFHRNRWGHCVPNRRAFYRPYPYYGYGPGYFADGHEPWNRPTPGDHVANQLNRRELRGGYWSY